MTETQTLNEDKKTFTVAGRSYTHRLLNYHYYNIYIEKLYLVLMKLNIVFSGADPFVSQNPLEFNKDEWRQRLSDIRLIKLFYELFVLVFHNRLFFYEDIRLTSDSGGVNIVSFFAVKPVLFILDRIQAIKTGRINFKRFIKSLNKIQMLDIFIDIMKTQTDVDVKKKLNQIMINAESEYFQVSQLSTSVHYPEPGKKVSPRPFPSTSETGECILRDPSKTEHLSENGF